jgi:SAM-dependent methyltransferase
MQLAYSPAEDNPLVRAVWRDAGLPAGVDRAIHADDEMLAFLAASRDGDRDRALADYFLSGFQVAETFRALLDWWFGGAARAGSVLDFASGYGRVTRFLVHDLAPERLRVADVYAGGVRFQEDRFGVRGIASTIDPDGFRPAERFDAILVASLFSHLPEPTFHGWLEALWRLVAPGGILVFSVHDESLVTPWSELPPAGLLFAEVSESASLGKGDYGTAWVSEDFVRRAVARVAPRAAVHRLPRALQHFQDLYVASNGAGDRPPLARLRLDREPLASIETLALAAPDRLEVTGWVASAPDAGEGEVAAVEALLDGQVAAQSDGLGPRPDVDRAALGEPLAGRSFWLAIPLPPGISRAAAILSLRAVDRRGRPWLLAASSVDAALLDSARRGLARAESELARAGADHAARLAAANARRAGLEARLAAMEASRFWKLRRRWFALKRLLRLTDEE